MKRSFGIAAMALAILALAPLAAFGGGPRNVAGVSLFNAGAKGTPLTWQQGVILYYTDQGNLSTLLPGSSADALVAAAFARWTSIPTAAISAMRAGPLAEDVNGANVLTNANGTITLPADILPSATSQPVAVVYDADGSVIDALLGQSASNASFCAANSAVGGLDSFSPDAHLLHALIVLNGNCAQTAAQLPDLSYHLVRLLGQVFGLDWSQVNLNVLNGQPNPPAPADFAGFPVMHVTDPGFCVPISTCYPVSVDPTQPKPDDQAAISRLYPVTAQNQSAFPGKQIFADTTARIHGTVYFADANGLPAQPMQGVNVVARWVDPTTGIPSRIFAVASVSGFLFRGNAGNAVTGFSDSSGQPYDRFGSDDPAVEGFFDLAGLQIPSGRSPAEFEVRVEAVDPLLSTGMQPYGNWQVQPSGSTRVFVGAGLGQDIQQDILMSGSAASIPEPFGSTSFATPASVPQGGDWVGTLNPYGGADYFSFPAQANRTLSVAVTALDETGAASSKKAQPVIGMWTLASTQTSPAPAQTSAPLNTLITGESRLDALLNATTSFRLGISDLRGDGRPDFRYHAHLFYGDNISPIRASVAGGTPLTIQGLGFRAGNVLNIAALSVTLLAISPTKILAIAPGVADGVQSVNLQDPTSGGSSTLIAALTYGAGPNDLINLVGGANQVAPVGGQPPSPVTVQIVAPDGSPVAGASVFFSSTPAASLAACSGAASCTLLSNESGIASSSIVSLTPGLVTITVQLAPATYNPPQQVQAVLNSLSDTLDVGLAPQSAWIAQGATLNVPLTARVLANGTPLAGHAVNFQVVKGSGLLTSTSVVSNASGFATSTLQLSSLAGDIQVSACIQNVPVDNPCLSFSGIAVPASSLRVRPVAGTLQIAPAGQLLLPVTVQVTDAAAQPHPVLGAGVSFASTLARMPQNRPIVWVGDAGITADPMPVILSTSETTITSDNNGQASLQPSSQGIQGQVLLLGTAGVGQSTLQFELQLLAPVRFPASAATAAVPISNLRRAASAH